MLHEHVLHRTEFSSNHFSKDLRGTKYHFCDKRTNSFLLFLSFVRSTQKVDGQLVRYKTVREHEVHLFISTMIFCVDLNLNIWMTYKIARISISLWSVKCQGSFWILFFLFHKSIWIIVNWKYYHVQNRLANIFSE